MRDSDKDFNKLVETLKDNYEIINKRHDQVMMRINGKRNKIADLAVKVESARN